MFSGCFKVCFSIVRHLSREPDFWAGNQIFKKFLKTSNMFSWCFLSVSCFFSIVRHLSREPDFWAENSVFKTFFKSLLTCLLRLCRRFCGCPQRGAAPYRGCFLNLRLFNSPDLRRVGLFYCCQAWTLETVLGGNTALTRWWTARSIDADTKR